MTLLLCEQASLCSVLQHFCYVGKHVSVCSLAPLFSTVLYLWVPIVICPSHSLLPVYTGKYLYVVYLNEMIYGNNYLKTKIISYDAKAYLSSIL